VNRRIDKKECVRNAWALTTSEPWPFEPEHKFHPERRWRFDWACQSLRLAIEIEGVTHGGHGVGRHQRAEGYARDCEKYNAALECGWAVLRYTQRQVEQDPVGVVEQVLRVAGQRREALYGRSKTPKCKAVKCTGTVKVTAVKIAGSPPPERRAGLRPSFG